MDDGRWTMDDVRASLSMAIFVTSRDFSLGSLSSPKGVVSSPSVATPQEGFCG
jgi:hypothetical protein